MQFEFSCLSKGISLKMALMRHWLNLVASMLACGLFRPARVSEACAQIVL